MTENAAAWALARDILFKPSRGAERLREKDAFYASLRIYAVSVAAMVLFNWLKPEPYPLVSAMAQGIIEPGRGLVFWVKVHAFWGTVLSAVLTVFLGWFSSRFSSSKLRMAWLVPFSMGLALMPLLPILLYKMDVIGKGSFALWWLLLLAAMAPGVRRRPADSWRSIAAFVLSLNAIYIALFPFLALGALLHQRTAAWGWSYIGLDPFYFIVSIAMLFWTLGLGTYMLGSLERFSKPRAFMALALSILSQELFIASLHSLGLLPKEVLKAMMF
ncbi:MAG: hypothetical protein HY922_09110 [Elusimicrobia bacterium]|nr:hypothetical protein [Elusimicrobiota bacterium]